MRMMTVALVSCGLAVAAMMAPSVAAQSWGSPEGPSASRTDNLGTVFYNGGRFVYVGRGEWIEYGIGQQIKARFTEMSRSGDWIDLDDPSRDLQIRLNIASRVILITEHRGNYRMLYAIQSVQRREDRGFGGGRRMGREGMGYREGRDEGEEGMGYRERPREEVRDVDAGQWLVNQFDAQRVCPGVASRAGGEWNGQFRTVRPTVSSVCGVRFR